MIANHFYSSRCTQESCCSRCSQESCQEGWLQEGQKDRRQEGWQEGRQESCQEGCQEGCCPQEVRNQSLTKCVRLIQFHKDLNKLFLCLLYPLIYTNHHSLVLCSLADLFRDLRFVRDVWIIFNRQLWMLDFNLIIYKPNYSSVKQPPYL